MKKTWRYPLPVHRFRGILRSLLIAVALCTNSRKEFRRDCSPIGHNNTKHFLCPIRSKHSLEFLEIVWWESVPRGSFSRTWKLSSRLYSRPDWLPLGLRGWAYLWTCQLNKVTQNLICIVNRKLFYRSISSINSSLTDKTLPAKTSKPNFVTFVYFGNSLFDYLWNFFVCYCSKPREAI